jgi:hypothetical protein
MTERRRATQKCVLGDVAVDADVKRPSVVLKTRTNNAGGGSAVMRCTYMWWVGGTRKTLRAKVCREAVGMADVVALKAITMSSGLNIRSCNLGYAFEPERRWELRSSDLFKGPFNNYSS